MTLHLFVWVFLLVFFLILGLVRLGLLDWFPDRAGLLPRRGQAQQASPVLATQLVVSVGQNRAVRTSPSVSCSLSIPQRTSTIESIHLLIFTKGEWTLCTGFSCSSRG